MRKILYLILSFIFITSVYAQSGGGGGGSGAKITNEAMHPLLHKDERIVTESYLTNTGTTVEAQLHNLTEGIALSSLFLKLDASNDPLTNSLGIYGSSDTPQLTIRANATQSNTNPLILLEKSDGTDLLWLHSNDSTNVFLGINAGQAITTGTSNVFIGYDTGVANTIGLENFALGVSSMENNIDGRNNVGIGVNTLNANVSGNYNLAIGEASLELSTGNYNIGIGGSTGATLATGSSNILIGYGTDTPAANTSNYLNIGGIITGSLSTGALDLAGVWTANNFISDVAIGTSPYACTSTTLNTNLNADLWDGYQFADYLDQAVKTTSTPSFSTVNGLTLSALATGYSIAGGTTSKTLTVDETASLTGYAKKTDNLSVFASTTSSQLAGIISDETGTAGKLVFDTSPTLVTPLLGTPTSGNLANCTFPTLNQNTTGSAGSLKSPATTGLMTATGMGAGTTRAKTVRDADDTILELAGAYTPTGIWTSLKLNENVALTSTSTKLNYLTAATGTTGTTSTNVVFSTSPTIVTPTIAQINSAGDLTLDPAGLDVLVDGGLTVGSATQAGDNNLRVEGTSALVGNVTLTGDIAVNGSEITSTGAINIQPQSGSTSVSFEGIVATTDTTFFHYGATDDIYLSYGTSGTVYFRDGTVVNLTLDSSGNLDPRTAGSQNFGNATYYWADVSYKTLTDRSGIFLADKDKSYNMFKNLKAETGKGHCKKLEDKGKARLKFSDLKAIDPDMIDLALEPAEEDIIFDDNVIIDNQITTEVFEKGDYIARKGELTRWRKVNNTSDDGKVHITQTAEGLELTAYISHLTGALRKSIDKIETLEHENQELKERISRLEGR